MALGPLREDELLLLRRDLPLFARARPNLLLFLRQRAIKVEASTPLLATDVFDAGAKFGIMCRFVIRGEADPRTIFVAPLGHIALARRCPTVCNDGRETFTGRMAIVRKR